MPIRYINPFIDPLADLNLAVNRYAQLLKDGGSDPATPLSYGPGLKSSQGGWGQKLAGQMGRPPKALWVEIGCHHGATALELAEKSPDHGIIAIDITFKRVVKTAKKALVAGAPNLHAVLCNAVGMPQVFAEGEIDGILLFFPDPWVRKKSQRKNRLLGDEFAKVALRLLAPGGFFWFKTDQLDYFEQGAAALRAAGFVPYQNAGGDSLPVTGLSPTTFESYFSAKGIPAYGACWQKPPSPAFIEP